jgi:phenylacetate-CoA ligase
MMFEIFSRHVIAPAWAIWEWSPYLKQCEKLRKTQYGDRESLQGNQWRLAESLLSHAYRTTPFWRSRFEEANLTPGDIKSFEDFSLLPLTTKSDLREKKTQLRSTDCPTRQFHQKTTSGSTGVSVEVIVDDAAHQFKRACTLRSDEWSGWRLGERIAALWGNPEYTRRGWRGWLRNALLDRRIYLDTLKMDESSLAEFAEALRRRPPSLLFGHAHSLYLFAEYVRERGGSAIRPKGIISAAMILHDFERRLIEDVFRCKVTNRYGCEEVSLIACECERHEGLHVNSDGIYLEILRSDGTHCESGEHGRVVVTDLLNRAMPILRYEVGDMATWSKETCSCGRTLPLLEKIEGRVADYVKTPRGEWVSGISLTENFAVLVPGISQLQIIQESLDRFTFRIVRGADFGLSSERRIRQLVAERFGSEVCYECEFVERIPQEASGKYRFCISKMTGPNSLPQFGRRA